MADSDMVPMEKVMKLLLEAADTIEALRRELGRLRGEHDALQNDCRMNCSR